MEVLIGYEPREQDGFDVAVASIKKHNPNISVSGIYKNDCQNAGLYTRPTCSRRGKLWDILSNAPMSTEFAITRFLVPWLAPGSDWVLFIDCDMLIRCDLEAELTPLLDDKYALMCVKHDIEHGTGVKMDDCIQTSYPRKNWSSVMAWNLKHPAHDRLTLKMVNKLPGRDLHQFCWLRDDEIGELPAEWNHLVNLMPEDKNAKIVHFTLGIPSMLEYANEWYEYI